MIRLRRLALALTLLISFFAARLPAFADDENKVDLLLGFYSLSINNSATGEQKSFSGLGVHQVRYRRAMMDHFNFGVGYSYFTTSTLSGSSYYGLDLSGQYYPLTSASIVTSISDEATLQVSEKLRPYVGLGFHQRSFEGIQTSYVGFSASIGADYALANDLGLIFDLRYLSLSATSSLTGHETSASVGVSFGF